MSIRRVVFRALMRLAEWVGEVGKEEERTAAAWTDERTQANLTMRKENIEAFESIARSHTASITDRRRAIGALRDMGAA